MLTGLYDHHTRVTTNHTGDRLDDASTIATWFDDAGYLTGLFGKYLNGYPFERGAEFVPPGWDEWHAFIDDGTYNDGYYDYALSENGTWSPTALMPRTTRPTSWRPSSSSSWLRRRSVSSRC